MKPTHFVIRSRKLNTIVRINGKIIYPKIEKKKKQFYTIYSDLDSCRIKIYSLKHELSEPYWWIFALLFYIISIFGIFNPGYSKNFYYLEYEGILDLTQDNIDLQLQNPKEKQAIVCLRGTFDNNESNHFILEPIARKRYKLYTLLKFISWAILLIIIIMLLILFYNK